MIFSILSKAEFQYYEDKLLDLYVDAFGNGEGAQYIERGKIADYFQQLFQLDGQAIVALDNGDLCGALLFCPCSEMNYVPDDISSNFFREKSIYIAELMVASISQGRGIGAEMLVAAIQCVEQTGCKEVFLRVWDKNSPALHLYRKFGFEQVADLNEIRLRPDGKEPFPMRKLYLRKKLA